LEPLAGGPFLLCPPPQLALREQRPVELEGHREALMMGEGLLDRLGRAVWVLLGGEQQGPGPGGGGKRPRPAVRPSPSLEAGEEFPARPSSPRPVSASRWSA